MSSPPKIDDPPFVLCSICHTNLGLPPSSVEWNNSKGQLQVENSSIFCFYACFKKIYTCCQKCYHSKELGQKLLICYKQPLQDVLQQQKCNAPLNSEKQKLLVNQNTSQKIEKMQKYFASFNGVQALESLEPSAVVKKIYERCSIAYEEQLPKSIKPEITKINKQLEVMISKNSEEMQKLHKVRNDMLIQLKAVNMSEQDIEVSISKILKNIKEKEVLNQILINKVKQGEKLMIV